MDCTYTSVDYSATGYFSSIVIDYLKGEESLRPFYQHLPNREGLEASILAREKYRMDRSVLTKGLTEQYSTVPSHSRVDENIRKLGEENAFTIVTAHQPAIFTGTLYFIYKILHVIRMAEELNQQYPSKHFIPVYFMGSEDADLDELGKIYLSGDTLRWNTNQQGSVGRMKVKDMDPIMNRIKGELGVLPFGNELVSLLENAYQPGISIQQATFSLLHTLFASYGLVIFIPDNKTFKAAMVEVFKKDLFDHLPAKHVNDTIALLEGNYKIQVNPREINLFYFNNDRRDRLERIDENHFGIVGSETRFTKDELEEKLIEHPELFSPNVILRGVMQEMLLPNVAFIGGGGELAYWLEYRNMFNALSVPFPLLLLRNSFLVIEEKWYDKIKRLKLSDQEIFSSSDEILKRIAKKTSGNQLTLEKEINEVAGYYERLKELSVAVDPTLENHVKALQTRTIKPLVDLEKKIVRAEKRKFEAEQRQVEAIRRALFPNNSLQERLENFMPYFAKYGQDFFECIYKASGSLDQEFRILRMR